MLFTAGLRARPLQSLRHPLFSAAPRAAPRATPGARTLSTRILPGTPRARTRLIAVLSLLPLVGYYLSPRRAELSPQVYSDHPVSSTRRVGPAHVEVAVALDDNARELFAHGVEGGPYGVPPRPKGAAGGVSADTQANAAGAPADSFAPVVVQHVMVKNPQLMIERAYTPINDAAADGEMRLVVKRVRGGEVGRLLHSLKPGDDVGLRGPVTTFALRPEDYDTVVMISTGTAVAPFLQLLAKTPTSAGVQWKLLQQAPAAPAQAGAAAALSTATANPAALGSQASGQALTAAGATSAVSTAGNPAALGASPGSPAAGAAGAADWSAAYIAPMQARWGSRLDVRRVPQGHIRREDVERALDGAGRVLVLVCLPTPLMRPLCGALAPTLHQGPLVGMLADLGLRPDQVWKLE